MATTFDLTKFESSLQRLIGSLPKEITPALRAGVPDTQAAKLCTMLRKLAKAVEDIADTFDPVRPPMGQIELFAPMTIGRLIGQELIKVEPQPLANVGDFHGSGIYALYYTGAFPAYSPITYTDCPIYIGVGHPRSRHTKTPIQQGRSLANRLSEHRKNISAANGTISLDDFQYRYLVTESGWQGTAEEFLIWLYWPVWNKEMKVCSGFGKHGDIARKELSAWDVLHGGRKWTTHQQSRKGKTAKMVMQDIQEHYLKRLKTDTDFWSKLLNAAWVKRHSSES